MLGALSLMEFRAYLKMCHQQAEKLPTLTDSALCLTRNNRVLLEGSGKSKILQTGSNSQQNNSGWGVKMFFIGIIAAFFIIIGIGYPLCAAIIYPIYRVLGGKQSFFDYMNDV